MKKFVAVVVVIVLGVITYKNWPEPEIVVDPIVDAAT